MDLSTRYYILTNVRDMGCKLDEYTFIPSDKHVILSYAFTLIINYSQPYYYQIITKNQNITYFMRFYIRNFKYNKTSYITEILTEQQ